MVRGPRSQNDRYWSPVNRQELVECKKAQGEKVMAWVGIIDGRCLPIVGFDGSVNRGRLPGENFEGHNMAKRQAYCNKEIILASRRWSKLPRYRTMFVILAIEIRRSNHLSQHATSLASTFARPPSLDYYFLSQCTQYVKEKPNNMCDLRRRVNRFSESIDEEIFRKMVRYNSKMSCCHFEQLL